MSALRELVVDSFAGGGGASKGIAMALVRANYLEASVEADPPQEPLFRAIA